MYLLGGVLLGATLGYVGGAVFALTQPDTSIRPGPDGAAITVAHDYSAVPIIGGFVGAMLGLVVGGLLAASRWRRNREPRF